MLNVICCDFRYFYMYPRKGNVFNVPSFSDLIVECAMFTKYTDYIIHFSMFWSKLYHRDWLVLFLKKVTFKKNLLSLLSDTG